MSAISSLSGTLASSLNNFQAQIKTIQTELVTGVKQLDAGQAGEVVRLSAQVTGYKAVDSNITQAQSIINVAQTGLSAITDILNQLQTLSNQASSAELSASDRGALNQTFQSLLKQVDSIVNSTEVNGTNLLAGIPPVGLPATVSASSGGGGAA